MKVLFEISEVTREARLVAENYFDSLENLANQKKVPAEIQNDFFSSLQEHLSIAIREELDKRKRTEVDAQIMMELLCSLGSKEELIDSLSDNYDLNENAPQTETAMVPKSEFIDEENIKGDSSFKPKFKSRLFRRSRKDAWIMGVCGGMGEYWGISPLLIRLLFLFSGIGIVAYLIIGFLMPVEDLETDNRQNSSLFEKIIASVFKLAVIILAVLPLMLGLGFLTIAGFSKIMFELGISGVPSADTWAYFVIGIPGLISGMANLLIGVCFITILLNFTTGLLLKRSILGLNTKKLLVLLAIFSISIQGGLLIAYKFSGDTQKSLRASKSYKIDDIKSITINFPREKVAWQNKSVKFAASNEKDQVTIEVKKGILGSNEKSCIDNLKSIEIEQSLQKNGNLNIVGQIPEPNWWFYPFPEAEIIIHVPANKKIACNYQDDCFSQGEVKLSKINQPINIESSTGRLYLTDIESPNISVKMRLGKVFARNLKVATASFRLNTGSLEMENMDFETVNIRSDLGSVELKQLNGKNLSLATRAGSQELWQSDIHTLNLQSDLGSINLERVKCEILDIKSKMGSIATLNSIGMKTNIETQMGSIEVNANEVRENSTHKISSKMGSIDLRLPQAANPNIKTSVKMGAVDNDFSNITTSNSSPKFEISTQMGSINIISRKTILKKTIAPKAEKE